MNKKELVKRINEELRATGQKKPIALERHTLHVSDDNGNSTDFVIREKDREVIYTAKDVEKILDACCDVVLRALENGEEVNVHGFGALKVKTHPSQSIFHVRTKEMVEVAPYCTPQFVPGINVRSAVKVYERTTVRSGPFEKGGNT